MNFLSVFSRWDLLERNLIFRHLSGPQPEPAGKAQNKKRKEQKQLFGIGLFVEHFQEHSNAFMCLNFDVANFLLL